MFNPLDLIFPVQCVNCHTNGEYLCKKCAKLINLRFRQRCPVCNKNSITGATHPRCHSSWTIDGVWASVAYRHPIKKLIHKWKYNYSADLTTTLNNQIIQNLPDYFKNFDILVPVPLHPFRKQWRGFNQAEKLAQHLSQDLKIELLNNSLIRTKNTIPQMQIKHREIRVKNLNNSFALNPKIEKLKIKQKSILIIDDITTTGTTLRQAAKPFKRAGAGRIWGIVIAR